MAASASAPTSAARTAPSSTSLPLHRRILYPPPLQPLRILHSASHSTLDPLLLDLIALICREYIQSWYSRISPDRDRLFVTHVAAILIHLVQALEVRLAHVDLVELVVLDLPALLDRHVADWDQAGVKAGTGHAHNYDQDNVFHLLQPHIAVSVVEGVAGPAQARVDPTYLRAMVDSLLRLLLPPEDYRAETERTIVREIVVSVIFGSLYGKVAQPWFLHSAVAKILEGAEQRRTPEVAKRRREASAQGKEPPIPVTFATLVDKAISTLSSIPKVLRAVTTSISALYHTATAAPVPSHYADQPPLNLPLFSLLTTLLPASPVLSQSLHYLQLPLTFFSSFLTSLVFHLVNDKLFTAATVQSILDVTTRSLFPDGHPPPRVPDPTPEEQEDWKRRCEEAVGRALPGRLIRTLVPDGEEEEQRLALAKHLTRTLGSHVANVHLFVLLVDLVIGKLFPEMVVGADD